MFGLRLGKWPRWLATTTPRPIKLLKELLAREGRDVVVTRGSTFENEDNLAPTFLAAVRQRYEGTRLGRQELNAELLSDNPGALWQLDWLDRDRVAVAPDLKRIVVAIDPAVSNNEGSDETGIIVAGVTRDEKVYVLEDWSGRYAPHEWAAVAIAAYRRHKADRILAEVNNGGAMVEATIRALDSRSVLRPYTRAVARWCAPSRSPHFMSSARFTTSAGSMCSKIRCARSRGISSAVRSAIRRTVSTRWCGR